MRFVLLAQEAHTLPYAIYMDESKVESVMDKAKSMANENLRILFRPTLLVDLENKTVYRVIGNPKKGYHCIDDAETQNMGRNTPVEWFEQEGYKAIEEPLQ